SPVDEPADLLNEWFPIDVELAARSALQEIQTVEQAAPGATPITGPFVATAIRRIKLQETIEAAEHFVDSSNAPACVRSTEQRRGQHAGRDPGRPIVRAVLRAGNIERHP